MSFMGSVRIALPEPHMLFPVNLPPQAPYVLLPAGSAIQVTGEENFRANLAPWLNAHGEAWVHATLNPVVETTARTAKTVAEVSIDGRPVGRLTPKMSQDMLPVVEYLGERGVLTCVPAIVKGNPLKSDVVLYTARAGELGVEWFAQFEGSTGGPIQPSRRLIPVQQPNQGRRWSAPARLRRHLRLPDGTATCQLVSRSARSQAASLLGWRGVDRSHVRLAIGMPEASVVLKFKARSRVAQMRFKAPALAPTPANWVGLQGSRRSKIRWYASDSLIVTRAGSCLVMRRPGVQIPEAAPRESRCAATGYGDLAAPSRVRFVPFPARNARKCPG